MFAAEILFEIFSHLSEKEVYQLRILSQFWKAQCEYHLFHLLKSRSENGQKEVLLVKLGKDEAKLEPAIYDCQHQTMTFQPSLSKPISGNQLQVVFSEWRQPALKYMRHLSLQDRALVMFHTMYNASLEHVYALPHRRKKHSHQYISDRGLIVKFLFVEDHTIVIDSITVNFSWLLGGFIIDNSVSPLPLFPERYQALRNMLLEEEGLTQYDEYTDSVTDYILNGTNTLVVQIHSKRLLLWKKLEALGLNPRLVYKYSSAKNWLLKDRPVEEVDQVVQVIQNSEIGWSTEMVTIN
ncbi:hypothetical protein [Parasitella parasitica]|uniref:F-box domain-containing protein n=1 Tax=Parasitella parasitica TaxID=35722 RepID=A0A0B7N6P6_9FUNG|nr:hypothetical protein [Parasitella parasitica]